MVPASTENGRHGPDEHRGAARSHLSTAASDTVTVWAGAADASIEVRATAARLRVGPAKDLAAAPVLLQQVGRNSSGAYQELHQSRGDSVPADS